MHNDQSQSAEEQEQPEPLTADQLEQHRAVHAAHEAAHAWAADGGWYLVGGRLLDPTHRLRIVQEVMAARELTGADLKRATGYMAEWLHGHRVTTDYGNGDRVDDTKVRHLVQAAWRAWAPDYRPCSCGASV